MSLETTATPAVLGLTARQRWAIRRAVREAPADSIDQVIGEQAEHYGLAPEAVARIVKTMPSRNTLRGNGAAQD